MKPSCICTFATDQCSYDLRLFLLSLNISNPGTSVVLFLDDKTSAMVKGLEIDALNLESLCVLNKYSGKNRHQMTAEGSWSDFQMVKSQIIDHCLTKYTDVLFLDSDIFILNPIEIPDDAHTFQIGLSPHYIKKRDTDLYGYFNGGVVWTNDKTFPEQWRNFTKTSRFFDQASLEDCSRVFKTFMFPENYNLSWWRIGQSDEPTQRMLTYITHDDTNVYYKGKPIAFVHTHFSDSQYNFFHIPFKHHLRNTSKTQLSDLLRM